METLMMEMDEAAAVSQADSKKVRKYKSLKVIIKIEVAKDIAKRFRNTIK